MNPENLALHLPLVHDAVDCGPHRLETRADGLAFESHPELPDGGAARFDGESSVVELPAHPALNLGTAPFTLTLRAHVAADIASVYGDLVSRFDIEQRRGLSVRIGASSPGYSGLSDARIVYAGIDDGQDGEWVDHGKPWASNDLISALVVHDGVLYAGIADAELHRDTPAVFAFRGGTDWERVGVLRGKPGKAGVRWDYRTRSIMSMLVHKGAIHAGTGCWNWEILGAGYQCAAEVWRYEGREPWTCLGQPGPGRRVHSLASFNGHLYAGMEDGCIYRWESDRNWAPCGQHLPHKRHNRLFPFQGKLYASTHGAVYVFDGDKTWTRTDTGGLSDNEAYHGENQLHCLQVYQSRLWVGGWPSGHALRMEREGGDVRWDIGGTLGIDPAQRCNEINDLAVHNGMLYAGVIPQGEVWRYDGNDHWTRVRRLVDNPRCTPDDYQTWNRVPCLAEFGGRLYAGTSNCTAQAGQCLHPDNGRVFSFAAGHSVSTDRDIGAGWHHLAFTRDERALRLFVDGKPVAHTALAGARLDLASDLPLLIGRGPQSHFRGALSDVRLYSRALTDAEIGGMTS